MFSTVNLQINILVSYNYKLSVLVSLCLRILWNVDFCHIRHSLNLWKTKQVTERAHTTCKRQKQNTNAVVLCIKIEVMREAITTTKTFPMVFDRFFACWKCVFSNSVCICVAVRSVVRSRRMVRESGANWLF